MKRESQNRQSFFSVACASAWLLMPFALLFGCQAASSGSSEAEAGVVDIELRPWPHVFERAALLVADDVYIEGPKGLLDHVALSQNADRLTYKVETLPKGFRQVVTAKDKGSYVQIKAALDALEITALKRIVVLERPGDVEVRVIARGGVWWRSTDPEGPLTGSEERRGERLELSNSAP